jgi:hypothetical protein
MDLIVQCPPIALIPPIEPMAQKKVLKMVMAGLTPVEFG